MGSKCCGTTSTVSSVFEQVIVGQISHQTSAHREAGAIVCTNNSQITLTFTMISHNNKVSLLDNPLPSTQTPPNSAIESYPSINFEENDMEAYKPLLQKMPEISEESVDRESLFFQRKYVDEHTKPVIVKTFSQADISEVSQMRNLGKEPTKKQMPQFYPSNSVI